MKQTVHPCDGSYLFIISIDIVIVLLFHFKLALLSKNFVAP